MRKWNFVKKKVVDDLKILAPMKWRKEGAVDVVPDVFEFDFATIDLVFAVMSACGDRPFLIVTKNGAKQKEYFDNVKHRGAIAGPAYEKRLRENFQNYKQTFHEGYSLPEPPTPEMRAIYDSAAVRELRRNPYRTSFSGGEFHWRSWPLDNVLIKVEA